METINHWKPIHENLIRTLSLAKNRVELYLQAQWRLFRWAVLLFAREWSRQSHLTLSLKYLASMETFSLQEGEVCCFFSSNVAIIISLPVWAIAIPPRVYRKEEGNYQTIQSFWKKSNLFPVNSVAVGHFILEGTNDLVFGLIDAQTLTWLCFPHQLWIPNSWDIWSVEIGEDLTCLRFLASSTVSVLSVPSSWGISAWYVCN